MEKTLGVTEIRKVFSSIIERVQHQGDIYIISRHGKPAAAVVPMEVYASWKRQRGAFFELIREMQQDANLTAEEAERIAAEAVAAVRARARTTA